MGKSVNVPPNSVPVFSQDRVSLRACAYLSACLDVRVCMCTPHAPLPALTPPPHTHTRVYMFMCGLHLRVWRVLVGGCGRVMFVCDVFWLVCVCVCESLGV